MNAKGMARSLLGACLLSSPSIASQVSDVESSEAPSVMPTEGVSTMSNNCSTSESISLCGPKKSGFFVGTEFSMLNWNTNTGGRINLSFDDSNSAGVDEQIVDGTGFDGYTTAPRLWLGYQFGEKWSVVGRYWSIQANESHQPHLLPGTVALPNFATEIATNRADAYSTDVEAVRRWNPGKWEVDTSVGSRYVNMNTETAIQAFGVFTTGNFVNINLSNGFGFDGAGVTYGTAWKRPICDSKMHFFASGRGSHLSGHTDSFASVAGTVASSPSSPLVGSATVRRSNADATLDIWEMQVGTQFDFGLQCIPGANAFFRAAFEGQLWEMDAPPTGGAGFGGTIGTLTTSSFSSAGVGDSTLYGLSLSTGFHW